MKEFEVPEGFWEDRDGDRWHDGPDGQVVMFFTAEGHDIPEVDQEHVSRSRVEKLCGPLRWVSASYEPAFGSGRPYQRPEATEVSTGGPDEARS